MFYCNLNKSKKINTNLILKKFHDHGLFENVKPRIYSTGMIDIFSDNVNFVCNNQIVIEGRITIVNKNDFKENAKSDFELVEVLYKKYGPDFVKKMNGDFSFIVWDVKNKELLIYRDHIGNYPLYYSQHNDIVKISSFLPLLLAQTSKPLLNENWIQKALMNTVSPKNETTYKDIFRFQPAYYYVLNSKGMSVRSYWNFDFNSLNKSGKNYVESFKSQLSESILSRSRKEKLGCELSAGLDSSSIAATLLNNQNTKLHSYTHAISTEAKDKFKPFTDETELIQFMKKKYPHLVSTAVTGIENSLLDDIGECLIYSKELPQQQIHIVSKLIYQQAQKDGIITLYSGFGGDEVVSSYGYHYLLELLFRNKFGKIFRLIIERKHNRISYIRLILKKFLDVQLYQLGFNHSVTKNFKKKLFIKNKTLLAYERINNKRNIEPKAKNYNLAKLKESISISHITSRIENCNILAGKYQLTVTYPLVDKKLLEKYLSMPNEFHNTAQWPRRLMRESLQNIVPDEIRLRRDKTIATVPNLAYRIYKDQNRIREYLKSYDRNCYISDNMDIDGLLQYFENFLSKSQLKNEKANPRTLINYLTILIFFELYESGELFNDFSTSPPQSQKPPE